MRSNANCDLTSLLPLLFDSVPRRQIFATKGEGGGFGLSRLELLQLIESSQLPRGLIGFGRESDILSANAS